MQNTEGLPLEVRLSAYIDGEVSETERKQLEELIASSDDARTVYETLQAGSAFGNKAFEEILHDPVPLSLVRRIKQGPGVSPRSERVTEGPARLATASIWPKALAASVALLAIGGTAGYMIGHDRQSAGETQLASRTWLDDVADYHRVYSRAGERLVEVPATAGDDGIETWLTTSTGVDFNVPDLARRGLTFEGARLLVAAGKPVAQLMYRDTSGKVVAICFQKTTDASGALPLTVTKRGDLELLTWRKDDATYVVVAPSNTPALRNLAETVSTEI